MNQLAHIYLQYRYEVMVSKFHNPSGLDYSGWVVPYLLVDSWAVGYLKQGNKFHDGEMKLLSYRKCC